MALIKGSEFFSKSREHPKKICGHNGCANELGPRVDGEHHQINGKDVCESCYFDDFGKEIDKHPIGGHRMRR